MLRSTDYIARLDGDESDALAITEWLANQSGALPTSAWEMLYDWAHENPDAWPMVTLPDGMSQSVALSLMASRAPMEARFNPNHDRLGRFSSSQFGSWSEMDLPTARAEQADINMQDFGGTRRQMEILADRQIPEGMRVFQRENGRTFVHPNADVDDAHLGQMFRDMDDLNARFPVDGKTVINIQPRYKFTDKALGETYIGRPVYRFSDDMVMGRNIKFDPDRSFHPAGFYADPRKNLIAHEYGHSIDKTVSVRNAQDKAFWQEHRHELSRYGSGYDASEGFAEAFSDYITTPKTEWMSGTAAYVTRYGWEGK